MLYRTALMKLASETPLHVIVPLSSQSPPIMPASLHLIKNVHIKSDPPYALEPSITSESTHV